MRHYWTLSIRYSWNTRMISTGILEPVNNPTTKTTGVPVTLTPMIESTDILILKAALAGPYLVLDKPNALSELVSLIWRNTGCLKAIQGGYPSSSRMLLSLYITSIQILNYYGSFLISS